MTEGRKVDWSLYLVIGRDDTAGRDLFHVLEAALEGGVTVVQWREKGRPFDESVALARRMLAMLRPRGVPLLINDRVDVALAAGADGVHLGQSDMPIEEARRRLGPGALIGLSVETPGLTEKAAARQPDYLGAGPVYATSSKADAPPPIGCEGLRALRQLTKLPMVAIGGINASNVSQVIRTGVEGAAVLAAVCSAADPRGAAIELLRRIAAGRRC